MSTKKLSNSFDQIVTPLALLAVGICFTVWADEVTEWIAIILGICAILYAVFALIRFLKSAPELRTTISLFYIILAFSAGVLLVSRASFIKEAISFVVGVYIILSSSISLLNLSSLRRKTGLATSSYIWPAIGIVVGLLCITGQFIIPNELARLTGIVLVIYAIADLISFFTLRSVKKQAEKEFDAALGIKEGKIIKERKSKNTSKSKK